MANVIQAAKWMDEGKRVTRPVREFESESGDGRIWFEKIGVGFVECRGCCKEHRTKAMLVVDDLLADDWQVVTTPTPEREEI